MLRLDGINRPMPERRRHNLGSIGVTATIFCACLAIASPGSAQTPEFRPQVVIERAFPTIKDAPVITVNEAERLLAEQELVIGVVVNGNTGGLAAIGRRSFVEVHVVLERGFAGFAGRVRRGGRPFRKLLAALDEHDGERAGGHHQAGRDAQPGAP